MGETRRSNAGFNAIVIEAGSANTVEYKFYAITDRMPVDERRKKIESEREREYEENKTNRNS